MTIIFVSKGQFDGYDVLLVSSGSYVMDNHIIPDADNTYDIGDATNLVRALYINNSVRLKEGFATGFKPAGVTNYALHFAVPTAGGKTEARVSFQTGGSVVYATEP